MVIEEDLSERGVPRGTQIKAYVFEQSLCRVPIVLVMHVPAGEGDPSYIDGHPSGRRQHNVVHGGHILCIEKGR